MMSVSGYPWRQWLKVADHPLAATVRSLHRLSREVHCPVVPGLHRALYVAHGMIGAFWHRFWQFWYYTPLFKSRLAKAPAHLQLYSGMPQVAGQLQIEIGENCRISGRSSLFGRGAARECPLLKVGQNVDIGWQNTIAVGSRVVLHDHVRLAGNVYLAGFPGHPFDPAARARGECETDEQVGDIVLEENVWVASGVTILAGVTIGRNSIIGAGSVVTKDIPANVIAAGCPAKVVRVLPEVML